ncbi:MAG: ABC transporter permease [Anaerolineales bacterium]|nr:ABC transporter permease [Anaerolineales bacterium]
MMRIRTRWRKILKDMWGSKTRSLLVVLSIAVGVASVGMITNAARILQRDLYRQYAEGNPALLQIFVSPFQDDLLKAVRGMREVHEVEARRVAAATIYDGELQPADLSLNVLPDYQALKVNRFSLEQGSAEPGVREVLLERQSAQKLGVSVGDMVDIEMPNERRYTLRVAGIVHDVYVMPFSLLGEATGYISMDTLQWLGERPYYNQLDIVVSSEQKDKEAVLAIGKLIQERTIEPAGYTVNRVQIPGVGSDPGKHWAEDQIKGFLLILQIMGVMAIFLSGGLVVNTVSSIITHQVKQIGIMRSIGATRAQIIAMYLVNVLVYSAIGLLIAIPLGLLGAWWLADFAARFLNFDLGWVTLTPSLLGLQIALGLLMPLGVALVPILNGTKISVYAAIYEYGLSAETKHGVFERLLGRIRRVSPPLVLSFRNTFREKERLAFTLITLTLAGAMFIAVFSTRASLTAQINDVGRYIYYDASLGILGGANKYAVEREALRVPGVNLAEGWANSVGVILRPDGSESQEFDITGLPYDAATIQPLVLQGRWLQAGDARQVVINEDLLGEEPSLRVGDEITLKVGETKQSYQIVGLVSRHLSGPRVYLDYSAYTKLSGRTNQVDVVRVLASADGLAKPGVQSTLATQLEERFQNANFNTGASNTHHAFIGKFTDVFDIILVVLVIMAALLAVVGGLGLTGAMGMNVLERTREIGVLRAVGASNFTVRRVVVVEGVVVGLMSWVMGAFLSGPSGLALADAVVQAVLNTRVNYHYSVAGLFLWLVIVLLIGILSSLAPALRAARLQVREVLDYE